jgi:hypothetical protein
MDFQIERVLRKTTFEEERRSGARLAGWLAQPPHRRVAAVEFLRRQHIGPGARLQRVLAVADRERR